MNRAQFLEVLRSQLTGKMYAERVEAHLRYYEAAEAKRRFLKSLEIRG